MTRLLRAIRRFFKADPETEHQMFLEDTEYPDPKRVLGGHWHGGDL